MKNINVYTEELNLVGHLYCFMAVARNNFRINCVPGSFSTGPHLPARHVETMYRANLLHQNCIKLNDSYLVEFKEM